MMLAFNLLSRLLALFASQPTWNPHPGEDIPYAFTLATIDGGNFTLDPENGKGTPLVFHAFLPQDAALRYMWHPDNADTLAKFLRDSPAETHYLFISYGLGAVEDMKMMRDRLVSALEQQGKFKGEIDAALANFHFSQFPMSGVSDQGANFLPNLMGHWKSARAVVKTRDLGLEERLIERLDTAYDWIPWPPPDGEWPIVPFGDGCTGVTPFGAAGGVALVVRDASTSCSFAEIISRAQVAGAAGVLVSAIKGQDVVQMRCQEEECRLPLRIFASMIPFDAALQLQEAALVAAESDRSVKVSFSEDTGPGYFGAVDELGRLQEVGWIKFPTLQHLSWAAQWLSYAKSLRAQLADEGQTLVVPVFEDKIMQGEHGIVVEVDMPPQAQLDKYSRLELDFELSCPGTLDADCPIWDHIIQLFVCCDGDPDCDSCDVTPWLHQHHPEDPAEVAWKQITWQSKNATGNAKEKRCGRELGRWVTPFRRRIGRWLTDVTPLRSLVAGGGSCRFTAQTAPWALPWKPSLRLRYSQQQQEMSAGGQPILVAPLFEGGTFDESYNSARQPVHVTTPNGTEQALLVAVITGHGSDEFNCAEFCPTSHHFFVNGHELLVNFTEAGTQWGCTEHVLEGVEPNEHGTWQYGRGGWCDGVNVPPRVFTVTEHLAPEGKENLVKYKGLFQDRTPKPKNNPGYIMMQSSLVFLGSQHPAIAPAWNIL